MEKKFDDIVNHLITSGFVYPGSEIYGGLGSSWDYGPLGVELKNKLKQLWWNKFVHESPYNVGVDSAIIMNSGVWKATGHVQAFNDPRIDCKECKARFRADQLIKEQHPEIETDGLSDEELDKLIVDLKIKCPRCGKSNFTNIRKFNMMFKTHIGVIDCDETLVYLRPETAQGQFVNFKNVQRSSRKKLPFGICQIGKSFRNEITPGNFLFRQREFEQMELEFFCYPGTDLEWFKYWKDFSYKFVVDLGISEENLRLRDHSEKELAFYSKATTDIEYKFPFGWGELLGVADRTDYDLNRHSKESGESLDYLDAESNKRIVPYCIEPSFGVDRLFLMIASEAYDVEELPNNDSRIVMHFKNNLAPYFVAVLPLSKKLNDKAMDVYKMLLQNFQVIYDETGSIGKRYRREDAIGTPFCVTIDFDTLTDEAVTIRERDSMAQIRLPISELEKYLLDKLKE